MATKFLPQFQALLQILIVFASRVSTGLEHIFSRKHAVAEIYCNSDQRKRRFSNLDFGWFLLYRRFREIEKGNQILCTLSPEILM